MKIIGKDNYDRDNVSDLLICENVNEYWGKLIVKKINESGVCDDRFLVLVPDDHKLYKWEP